MQLRQQYFLEDKWNNKNNGLPVINVTKKSMIIVIRTLSRLDNYFYLGWLVFLKMTVIIGIRIITYGKYYVKKGGYKNILRKWRGL